MAMEQYSQGIIPQNNFVKDNVTSSDKWNSLSEAVDESENSPSAGFDCNICLDSVHDPVVTLCGHLYCWPCIYKWIHHQNASSEIPNEHNPECPVCKRNISQKTLVPLYGRGQTTEPESNEKAANLGMAIPRRPSSPSSVAQQLNHRSDQQQITQEPMTVPNVINPTSPTTGMLGEMVYGTILGNIQASLYAYPNSYNLASISTRRARRQAMQADKSLGRICFFLFCCMMLCLIFF